MRARPPDQSGWVGSSPQSAKVSDAGAGSAGSTDDGAGYGSRGGGPLVHARQNGVNTRYGSPFWVVTVHGSNMIDPAYEWAATPLSPAHSLSPASTARSGPP